MKLNLSAIDPSKVWGFVTTNAKKFGNYISENKVNILKWFGAAVGVAITSACGGTAQLNTGNGNVIRFPTIDTQGILTLTPTQAAIAAIEKDAINNGWFSDKDHAIQKIVELIPKNADQYTKMYAISALQRIGDSAEWSATKRRALDAIAKLV